MDGDGTSSDVNGGGAKWWCGRWWCTSGGVNGGDASGEVMVVVQVVVCGWWWCKWGCVDGCEWK